MVNPQDGAAKAEKKGADAEADWTNSASKRRAPKIRYTRDALIALHQASPALQLPVDPHPVLNSASLPPNCTQPFDMDEWSKAVTRNTRNGRGRGGRTAVGGGNGPAATTAAAGTGQQQQPPGSNDSTASAAPERRGSEDAADKWERGAKVKKEQDLWDDVEPAGGPALEMGLSDMAAAAEKFRVEMRKMREEQKPTTAPVVAVAAPSPAPVVAVAAPAPVVAVGLAAAEQDELTFGAAAVEEAPSILNQLEMVMPNESRFLGSGWGKGTIGSAALVQQPVVAPQQQSDEWFYLDPQANQQGPFKSSEMRDWFDAGYFKPNLPVRQGRSGQFTPLAGTFGGTGVPFAEQQRLDGIQQQRLAQQQHLEQQRRHQMEMEQRQQREQMEQLQKQHQLRMEMEQQQLRHQEQQQRQQEQQVRQQEQQLRQEQQQRQEREWQFAHGPLGTIGQMEHSLPSPAATPTPTWSTPTDVSNSKKDSNAAKDSMARILEQEKRKAAEERQRAEAEQLRLQKEAAAKTSKWGSAQSTTKSLKQIQQEEQVVLKARRLAASKQPAGKLEDMGTHLKMMLGVGAGSNRGTSPKWSNETHQPKSLLEIQADEEHSAQRQKQQQPPRTGGAWSNVVAGGAGAAPVAAVKLAKKTEDSSFWNFQQQAAVSTKPIGTATTISSSTNGDSFMAWCEEQVKKLGGNDHQMLMQFCLSLEDAGEIREYLAAYLGSTPAVSAFATEFIQRKKNKKNAKRGGRKKKKG